MIARGQNLPAGVRHGTSSRQWLALRAWSAEVCHCSGSEIDECLGVKTSRLLLVAAALGGLSPYRRASGTDLAFRFRERRRRKPKPITNFLLLDFTGSDWCIWCKKLEAEVFTKPEFQKYAADHLVLMTVDFPRAKPLTAAVRKQNEELAEKYGIEGFPTVVVLNGDGKQVGELGYEAGRRQRFRERA